MPMAEGIELRVAKDGTRTYRASVWSNREGKRIRKSFPLRAAVARILPERTSRWSTASSRRSSTAIPRTA